jgi:LacI family transcriptional regulator
LSTAINVKNKLRLADIAERAGVSTATVDRVIHNRPGVKPHTVSHIQAVIAKMELGDSSEVLYGRSQGMLNFDIILPEGSNSFFNTLEHQIRAISQTLNGTASINIRRIEGFDPSMLAQSIHQYSKTSDGIALVAIEDPMVRDAVRDAVEAGIPVVTLVSNLSNSRHQAYVGLDNRAAGRTAGYLMGRLTPSRGHVLLIAGSMSLRDHEEREMGFRRALAEQNHNLQIIAHLEDHDDYKTTYEETCKVLQNQSNLVGIYNIGAGNRGVVQALKESGREKSIVFIGHKLTPYTRKYLIDDVMDVVIDQNPRAEAEQLMGILINLSRIQPLPFDTTPQEVRVYFRENLP